MAKVNLLPWRAERRRARQREFYSMLGATAIAAVVLGLLVSFYYGEQVEGQKRRNDYLVQKIADLDKKIDEIKALDQEKDRLLRRKAVIEQLQANRSQMVHLFDELVRTIPDGVRLSSVKQNGDQLELEGRSQSNARVSAYMRNIEASGWMTNPDLSIIEAAAGDKAMPYKFDLSLTLTKPGQLIGPDGKPVIGLDGKPMMAQPTSAGASGAPASASSSLPPAAPATPTAPAAPLPAATSKGGASQ